MSISLDLAHTALYRETVLAYLRTSLVYETDELDLAPRGLQDQDAQSHAGALCDAYATLQHITDNPGQPVALSEVVRNRVRIVMLHTAKEAHELRRAARQTWEELCEELGNSDLALLRAMSRPVEVIDRFSSTVGLDYQIVVRDLHNEHLALHGVHACDHKTANAEPAAATAD